MGGVLFGDPGSEQHAYHWDEKYVVLRNVSQRSSVDGRCEERFYRNFREKDRSTGWGVDAGEEDGEVAALDLMARTNAGMKALACAYLYVSILCLVLVR